MAGEMREPAVRALVLVCTYVQPELLSRPWVRIGTGHLGIHLTHEDRVRAQQVLALEQVPCGQCCSDVEYPIMNLSKIG